MPVRMISLAALLLAVGCGEKKAPTPAVEEAVSDAPPVAEEPEPEPVVEAEPVPEPPKDNADLGIVVAFGGGASTNGHVKRIERSSDWYAEEGWSMEDSDLLVALEGNGTLKDVPWSEIKSITVSSGKIPGDVDCTYSSDFTPWMYTCTLRTPTKATTTDGKSWTVTSRHKWRFTYDDDSTAEFWLAKHPARMQDTEAVSLEDEQGEDYEIYTQLQDQLRQEIGGLVKSVKVTAPAAP